MLQCSQQHHMTRLFSHQRVLFYFLDHLFVRFFRFIHCILALWTWNGGKFSRTFFAISYTWHSNTWTGNVFRTSRFPAPMPIWPKPCPGMWSLTPGPKRYFFPWGQVDVQTNLSPRSQNCSRTFWNWPKASGLHLLLEFREIESRLAVASWHQSICLPHQNSLKEG